MLFRSGVTTNLEQKTCMISTKNLKDGTLWYLPPEVLVTERGEPNALDVYAWGITLYQLLTGRTADELEKDGILRRTDYKAFLDNVQKLRVKEDPDNSIGKKIIEILQKIFSLDPKNRPNFSRIVSMLSTEGYPSNELEETKKKLSEVTKEKGNFFINCR